MYKRKTINCEECGKQIKLTKDVEVRGVKGDWFICYHCHSYYPA